MVSYPFPWDLFLALARDLPAGRRSMLADAREMVARMRPPPVVSGEEHIPRQGAVLVASNHYQRRGLWIGWSAAVITTAVATRRDGETPLRWLVTGGLRLLQPVRRGPVLPMSAPLFRRVAAVYGMTALPLRPGWERAVVLRRWLEAAEAGEALGVFPEGLAGRSDGLRRPEEGFDALVRTLGRRGVPILPVGVYERDEVLRVTFGAPVLACGAAGAGRRVMGAIAALLPAELRGPYRDELLLPAQDPI